MRTIDHLLARTLAAGVLAVLFQSHAFAVPIAAGSQLSINGDDTFSDNPAHLNFVGLGNVGNGTGSFAVLPACTGCVSFQQNLTAGSTGTLWTVADAGKASTFSITQVTSATFDGTPQLPNATVFANGVLSLTGFDDTSGVMELTTQGPHDEQVTFSATATPNAVPPPVSEPAALALVTSGLFTLGWLRWRNRRG